MPGNWKFPVLGGYFGGYCVRFHVACVYFLSLCWYFRVLCSYFHLLSEYFGALSEYFGALSRHFHALSRCFCAAGSCFRLITVGCAHLLRFHSSFFLTNFFGRVCSKQKTGIFYRSAKLPASACFYPAEPTGIFLSKSGIEHQFVDFFGGCQRKFIEVTSYFGLLCRKRLYRN
ncbi:hypothetical protein SAMN05444274_102533 [Mariniphaga anaerophila]|uniref:Uncharacterized protein n=1 Tax=Mariniphaga anaerophila TaxID=1484053 RepID=A0A1M4WRD2_9BACT|nr:hypothetical protein SAMN05444274_102533 [Mariniphaga anaerophila]